MNKVYAEITIRPHHSGFGMYETDPNSSQEESWEDKQDLLNEIKDAISSDGAKIYKLGIDELPEQVRDIRGAIYNEPTYVFAIVWPEDHPDFPGGLQYIGIEELTTEGEDS